MSEKIKTQGNRQKTNPNFMEVTITSSNESVTIRTSQCDSINYIVSLTLKVLEIVKKNNKSKKE